MELTRHGSRRRCLAAVSRHPDNGGWLSWKHKEATLCGGAIPCGACSLRRPGAGLASRRCELVEGRPGSELVKGQPGLELVEGQPM
jgi:hypothetical protein